MDTDTLHPEPSNGLADKLARFFRERPNQWLDARQLFAHGGSFGWRSRVSDIRRPPFNMTIRNRQQRIAPDPREPHRKITITEYKYERPQDARQLTLEEAAGAEDARCPTQAGLRE